MGGRGGLWKRVEEQGGEEEEGKGKWDGLTGIERDECEREGKRQARRVRKVMEGGETIAEATEEDDWNRSQGMRRAESCKPPPPDSNSTMILLLSARQSCHGLS